MSFIPFLFLLNNIISNFTLPQHLQCDLNWIKTPFTYFHAADCLVCLTLQPFFFVGGTASISSSKLQEQVSNCIPNHTCFTIFKLTKHQVKHAQHKTQTQHPTPYPYPDSPDDNRIAFSTEKKTYDLCQGLLWHITDRTMHINVTNNQFYSWPR